MQTIFMHDFQSNEDILREFEAPADVLDGATIYLAYYHVGNWGCDSSAFVLFEKDGKLYEQHGSHCSCHGLEGQWQPEETTIESLAHRAEKGSFGYPGGYDDEGYANESKAVIEHLNYLQWKKTQS